MCRLLEPDGRLPAWSQYCLCCLIAVEGATYVDELHEPGWTCPLCVSREESRRARECSGTAQRTGRTKAIRVWGRDGQRMSEEEEIDDHSIVDVLA